MSKDAKDLIRKLLELYFNGMPAHTDAATRAWNACERVKEETFREVQELTRDNIKIEEI